MKELLSVEEFAASQLRTQFMGANSFVVSLYFFFFFFFGFFYFAGFVLSWVIVAVELNCEIHIAHNLQIKLLKMRLVGLFLVEHRRNQNGWVQDLDRKFLPLTHVQSLCSSAF